MGGLAGCRSDTTGPFGITHTSRVVGTVSTPAGAPIDSVRVFIRIPDRAGFAYAVTPAMTNRDGKFSYVVQRMRAPTFIAEPDTVTVEVQGEVLKKAYYQPDGTSTKGSSVVRLTFSPAGSAVITVQANLHIPAHHVTNAELAFVTVIGGANR
jgi:hypothetical protein